MEKYLKSYILKYYFNHEDPAEKSKIANRIFAFSEIADLGMEDINDPYLGSDLVYCKMIQLVKQGCQNIIALWEEIAQKSWYQRQILQMRQILGFNIYDPKGFE